ncbi:hypothetical protein D3C87_1424060 [compost metagenome]
MPYVARTKIPIDQIRGRRDINASQSILDTGKNLIQCCPVTDGDVVNIILGFRAGTGSQYIGLDCVFYKTKVPTGFTITIHENFFVIDHGRCPLRNHGSISAIWILTLAKDVKIAKPNGIETVCTGKNLSIQFVYILRDRIRGKRFTNHTFNLRKPGMVPIGRTGRGISKTFYFRILCRNQHVQKTVDIGAVRCNRVIDGARDRA